MKNTKALKQENHEHAVIVCSIIGRSARQIESCKNEEPCENEHSKNYPEHKPERRLISALKAATYILPINSIISKIGEPLNFGKLHDNFLREKRYLIISEERKKKNDRLLDFKYPIVGEYSEKNKMITLYINNIEDYFRKIKGSVDESKKNNLIVTTYLHELFHSYFHFVTGQSVFRQHRYNYILEIEEAITEFCTLVYINDAQSGAFDWIKIFKFAYANISEKKKSKGDLSAYGFGAYLFDNIKNESERSELINNYIQKLGNIDETDKKVNEYIEKVRDPNNYEECINLLKEILKPTAN